MDNLIISKWLIFWVLANCLIVSGIDNCFTIRNKDTSWPYLVEAIKVCTDITLHENIEQCDSSC